MHDRRIVQDFANKRLFLFFFQAHQYQKFVELNKFGTYPQQWNVSDLLNREKTNSKNQPLNSESCAQATNFNLLKLYLVDSQYL